MRINNEPMYNFTAEDVAKHYKESANIELIPIQKAMINAWINGGYLITGRKSGKSTALRALTSFLETRTHEN